MGPGNAAGPLTSSSPWTPALYTKACAGRASSRTLARRKGAGISCRDHAAVRLRPMLYRFLLASLQPHASLADVIMPGSRLMGSMMLTDKLA